MKRVALSLILSAMLISSLRAETDTLIAAVGFALTGSDDAKVRAINRAQCVFGIGNEVFHLNNVHVDRISIQGWVQKTNLGQINTVTIDLHGEGAVSEETVEAGNTEGVPSAILENIRKSDPVWFTRHVVTSSEKKLTLNTSEIERVNRAWQYIYANGCVGKKSPF